MRDQMIITAANDLTTALLTKHDKKLMPPVGTGTQIHLLDISVTFHKLLPPEKEITDNSPIKI